MVTHEGGKTVGKQSNIIHNSSANASRWLDSGIAFYPAIVMQELFPHLPNENETSTTTARARILDKRESDKTRLTLNPFTHEEHHRQCILLDRLADSGRNYPPFKRQLEDNNAINLALDDTVYRIFTLEKFIRTLQSGKLCLVRPALWKDPFENFFLNSQGVYDGQLVGLDSIRDSWYGQCWTLRKECDGLWRN